MNVQVVFTSLALFNVLLGPINSFPCEPWFNPVLPSRCCRVAVHAAESGWSALGSFAHHPTHALPCGEYIPWRHEAGYGLEPEHTAALLLCRGAQRVGAGCKPCLVERAALCCLTSHCVGQTTAFGVAVHGNCSV